MRQCILQYVLLLLFYPWVMPDTRMYESLSSIFLSRFFVVYPQYNSGKPAINPLIATTHARHIYDTYTIDIR